MTAVVPVACPIQRTAGVGIRQSVIADRDVADGVLRDDLYRLVCVDEVVEERQGSGWYVQLLSGGGRATPRAVSCCGGSTATWPGTAGGADHAF